jgi:hypothetical protein
MKLDQEEIVSLITFWKNQHAKNAVDYAKKGVIELAKRALAKYAEDCLLLMNIEGRDYCPINYRFENACERLAWKNSLVEGGE